MFASRNGPIVPFIAETFGLNALVVDSSALLEQVTTDVLIAAFRSAGKPSLSNTAQQLWNGPTAFFERSAFANGTIEVMKVVSKLTHKEKLVKVKHALIGSKSRLIGPNYPEVTTP